MSQVALRFPFVIPPGGPIDTITGNDGIHVTPDGGGNINVVAAAGSGTFAGNIATHTLTYTAPVSPAAAVSFSAFNNASVNNVTGDGTVAVVQFNATTFNVGGGFNVATSTFTFPNTGLYFISSGVTASDFNGLHDVYNLSFTGSVESISGIILNPGVVFELGAALVQQNISTIIHATAGDTMTVTLQVNGSTKTVDIIGQALPGYFTWFRGYQIA